MFIFHLTQPTCTAMLTNEFYASHSLQDFTDQQTKTQLSTHPNEQKRKRERTMVGGI